MTYRATNGSASIQITVPTVRGREELLDECLASISKQVDREASNLKVAGNGTGIESEEVARLHGARFVSRQNRVDSEQHAKLLVSEARDEADWDKPRVSGRYTRKTIGTRPRAIH